MRKLLIIAGLLVLIATGYALYVYFQPVKKIAAQKTDLKITHELFVQDFNKNPQTADAKYRNKIIELSGKLKKTETGDSTFAVIFDDGGNYIVIASCVLEEKLKISQLKEKDNVIVKGIYSGYVVNDDMFLIPAEIKIDRCTLLP